MANGIAMEVTMHRMILAAAFLLPLTAGAQTPPPGMPMPMAPSMPSDHAPAGGMPHAGAMSGMPGMAGGMMRGTATPGMPTAPGQAAFGAIQEIVSLLESDPQTDWSRVDIDALRAHLVDMDRVTLNAQVTEQPIGDGMVFIVTGSGPVAASIQRMVAAHVATMNGAGPWRYEATDVEGGARLVVHVPAAYVAKLKALGFFGVLASGMHHQEHHLMIGRGMHPHG